nr:MAG TPA: hypothetical protein [Caudoviricetes sp.]
MFSLIKCFIFLSNIVYLLKLVNYLLILISLYITLPPIIKP